MTETSETKIALMDQRITSVVELCGKMSTAIEKIGNISSDLQSLSAVNNLKIETQKQFGEELSRTIEHQKKEFQDTMNEFHVDLSGRITSTETRIMTALDEMKLNLDNSIKDQKRSVGAIETRVSTLEKWRYTLVGAAIIVGGFIAYVVPALIEKLIGVTK